MRTCFSQTVLCLCMSSNVLAGGGWAEMVRRWVVCGGWQGKLSDKLPSAKHKNTNGMRSLAQRKERKLRPAFRFSCMKSADRGLLKLLLYNGTNRYIYDLKIMSLKAL